MKPSQCLYSSQRALYRVFVRPTPTTTSLPLLTTWRVQAVLPAQQARFYKRTPRQDNSPSLTEQVTQDAERKFDPRYTTAVDIERSGRSRLPQDHEITDPQIMVHERDVIEGPLRTEFVLTRIEPGESLRMVSPYVPATKEEPQKFAVCRIVDKKAEYEKEKLKKAQKQEKKLKAAKEKEIEVNWGIDENDLRTKIGTLARLMKEPTKVVVRFGKKKRSKAAVAQADMTALVEKMKHEVTLMGGREYKPAEGEIGQSMILHLASQKAKTG